MTTVLATPEELAAAELRLDGEVHRHLFRALRLRPGDRVRVADGAGRARWGVVGKVGRGEASLALGEAAASNEPDRDVTLLTAVPRSTRARWLVEKATEIGVVAVRFVACARSSRRLEAAAVDRLGRVARAAVEQSERARVPEVTGVHDPTELHELLAGAERRWILQPGSEDRLGESSRRPCALLVGPEGGWTDSELERLEALGCRRTGLGPTTLRVETAAILGASRALLAV